MKKMLIGTFLGMFALVGAASTLPVYAQQWTGDWENPNWDMLGGRDDEGSNLLNSAKKVINRVLWLLATIALVMCLYAGFLMVTSAWDEKKYKQGTTILKYAIIGLAVVGLSWLLVSLVSWFIGTVGWGDRTTEYSVND